MGKILCDSSAMAETLQAPSPVPHFHPDPVLPPGMAADPVLPPAEAADLGAETAWENVGGLEEQQRRCLQRLHTSGVYWKIPDSSASSVFRLSHGGDVEADGNCLFTASRRAMGVKIEAGELRRRTVRRFVEDLESGALEREAVDAAIRNMYSPDLKAGWGIHVVQEVKLLAKKEDRHNLDGAIRELVDLGLQRYASLCSCVGVSRTTTIRLDVFALQFELLGFLFKVFSFQEMAAESIYKERCIAVDDGPSWAKYMSICGSPDDECDIITLQYTEEGLLTVEENREGHAAAFGDDIAIESLATEFKREIYVVQAHGSDAMVDEDNCIFFLPHRPRSEICEPPFFLFMKGTGWCGAGADHYEPLIAHPAPFISQEKAAVVL
ncbi:hypothetical protein H6P81_012026 [Aristolochia fimbriata]|uniref:Uncharacterized protein n=1 Tax=Aristolochia fimbriata TaxID=158543 RepID=A0AAV7EAS6_ARIFI|nr:hypothetical protein H6P81_012026 [Aristolochia fimbriata]